MSSKHNHPDARLMRVFLCHSPNDKLIVRELHDRLRAQGWIDPWLDDEKIQPGDDTASVTIKAVVESDAALIFLSEDFLNNEGPFQIVFRAIMDEAKKKSENTSYVFPVFVERCSLPNSLQSIQSVNFYPKNKRNYAIEKLLVSLKERAKFLGLTTKRTTLVPTSHSIKVGPNRGQNLKQKSVFQLKIIDYQKTSNDLRTHKGHYVYTYGNLQFVQVPAGPFVMGSKNSESDDNSPFSNRDERPQVTIDIPYDYFIGRYPVTVAEYREFIERTVFDHEWEENVGRKSDHPVTCVTWERARDFCAWLNAEYGDETPVRAGIKLIFRLPTEPEWEKAARGEKGWKWPWGNTFRDDLCNSLEGYCLDTTPVGCYSERGGDSSYGAADMVGNVWEWTTSRYARYPYKSSDGRESNLGKGTECVVRGGCYRDSKKYARTTYRYTVPNASLYYFQGFRVVVAPPLSSIS